MGPNRRRIGKIGERIAVRFLASRGFSVLRRNFSAPSGEIDIIAEQNGCLVFLEVKTRISGRFGPPLSSITALKRKHILKNCRFYLKRHGLRERACRIDVIGIKLDANGKLETLKYIRNAIEAKEN